MRLSIIPKDKTIVVNGKYKTSGSFVSSYDELIEVIDLLIQKERVN